VTAGHIQLGIKCVLDRKLPFAGSVVGAVYRGKEKRFAHRAEHIISIMPNFLPFLCRLGVDKEGNGDRELGVGERDHITTARQCVEMRTGPDRKAVILYSETLDLERFPVGVNRDSQWGRKRQVLVGDSAFGACHDQTLFIGFAGACC
jgi:hypothetical protein